MPRQDAPVEGCVSEFNINAGIPPFLSIYSAPACYQCNTIFADFHYTSAPSPSPALHTIIFHLSVIAFSRGRATIKPPSSESKDFSYCFGPISFGQEFRRAQGIKKIARASNIYELFSTSSHTTHRQDMVRP